ncbi:hypothetical protein [Cardinium endosymbiont of Culicoides punctatus]|uniref:hypothetical protein n=1 Tax=Cardinium endosymbiont of Culicoides punctatus TaxID=2304601 RepID=UPI0010584B33|nr:hypothetical protein [Cardinium endosymbiont of Culicoides punctatus]TDG94099.1 hypothetical protein CCPUN_08510 [Cardinium endosymbiont of Culicoides punctatus]
MKKWLYFVVLIFSVAYSGATKNTFFDARVIDGNKGAVSAKTPVGKRGHKSGQDTGLERPELQLTNRNMDTIIEGRKFSGHALDRMQSRGILTPRAVSDTIRTFAFLIKSCIWITP